MSTPMTKEERLALARDIYQSIKDSGEYSSRVLEILELCIPIAARHLIALPEIPTFSRVTPVAILADNSKSLDEYPPAKALDEGAERVKNYVSLINGINFNFAELAKSKAAKGLEGLIFLLNAELDYVTRITGREIRRFHWTPVDAVPVLDPDGYLSDQGTPLYRRSTQMLATSVFRLEQWGRTHSIDGQTVNLFITDGQDTEEEYPMPNTDKDPRFYPADCAMLGREMQRTRKHQVHFWGLELKGHNYVNVAVSMGVNTENISVIPRDGKALRAKFQLFSQSASGLAASAGGGGAASFTRSPLPNVGTTPEPPPVPQPIEVPNAGPGPAPEKGSELGFGDSEATQTPVAAPPAASEPAQVVPPPLKPVDPNTDLGFGGLGNS